MSERQVQLAKWGAGVASSVVAGVVLFWLVQPGGLLNPGSESETDMRAVWREETLAIPVSAGGRGRVADLDSGRLLPLGASINASGADVAVRQAVHGIAVERGLSRGDGVTFTARFVRVGDTPATAAECAAAVIAPTASNHLELSSSLHVGSYVCMVTTEGRLAEFEVLRFDETQREIVIQYRVWEGD